VTVGAVSCGKLLSLLACARTGRHVGRPGVRLGPARRLQVTAEGFGPLNVDGEAWRELPATLEILPGAIRRIES
jgi:diacylglycerol kinase family enzyme